MFDNKRIVGTFQWKEEVKKETGKEERRGRGKEVR